MAWGRAPHTGVPEIGARPQAMPSLCASFNLGSLPVFVPFAHTMQSSKAGAGDDFWYPSMRNPLTPSSHSELRKKPIYFD
jgi:hypothetical protein